MSIKIVDVTIKTDYSWQDVSELGDWHAVKNTNANWQQLLQTSQVGNPVTISVEVYENNWNGVKQSLANWQEVKTRFANWQDLKNW